VSPGGHNLLAHLQEAVTNVGRVKLRHDLYIGTSAPLAAWAFMLYADLFTAKKDVAGLITSRLLSGGGKPPQARATG
jgi:hypothetical protein